MPIVPPGSKILVTGANGYIATWVVRRLLEQGYSVRGTARSKQKGAFLLDLFKPYGDKFELVVVEDFSKEGAFDEAVNGVDAIEHIATPTRVDIKDPKELTDPAVNGIMGVLRSSLKHTPNVKRVVTLSSVSAISGVVNEPTVFNENGWNEQAISMLEQLGNATSPFVVYFAAKTLAEKAAWEFYRKHEKEISWDFVALNPPMVYGPNLGPASVLTEINVSSQMWYGSVVAPTSGESNDEAKAKEEIAGRADNWIDVRDVAEALTKVLTTAEAGGERILICGGTYTWQDWRDVANSLTPSPIPSHAPDTDKPLPVGEPGSGKGCMPLSQYDLSKEKKLLGLKYRSMEETTRDTLADFERRGW